MLRCLSRRLSSINAGLTPVRNKLHLSPDALELLLLLIALCVLHQPAKLLWLSEVQPERFRAARRWMSFAEYLFLKLFRVPVTSVSMISGSGLWNQNQSDYDAGILSVLPIERSQLADVEQMDRPLNELRPDYQSQWPQFAGIPWFPSLGDGACDNVGSGCITPDHFALMVGTSGAMRASIASMSLSRMAPKTACVRAKKPIWSRFRASAATACGL